MLLSAKEAGHGDGERIAVHETLAMLTGVPWMYIPSTGRSQRLLLQVCPKDQASNNLGSPNSGG